MRGRAAAIACAFVLLCVALLTNGQRALDARAMEAERALALARGVAFAAAQADARDDDDATGLTQRVVTALAAQKLDAPAEVFLLQGTQFTVHTDPTRVNKRLDRDSLEDKALYDALARLKATV